MITMGELFLFSIAESLITKLASRAYEEASQVLGVYHHLHDFKRTLSYVKAVLLDAEQRQEQNSELKEWLRQIKRILSDAENVMDELECETLRKQVVKTHGNAKTKVGHFFSGSNPLVFRYRIAQQIKDISKRLDRVASDRHKFTLQAIEIDTRVVHKREMTYSCVIDSDVIGREQDRENIIQILLHQNPNNDNKNLTVIPIVGMGGLGKTTLAKYVFNDKRIHPYFSMKIWVCVSDDFDIKQLIVKIINSANDPASADASNCQQNFIILDMEQLHHHLRNKLAGQKFLLVLDDVWNEDRVKWVQLRELIHISAEGSKVLVTTRSHSIASMMGTVQPYILEGLCIEDSLSLFVKWAFKEEEEEKYPHLVNIGKEIVKKCGGVPLAVRTLGSLLFSKFEADEWEYVKDNEIWKLSQKKDDILPALKLSYDLMPSYLRQCFALFSLYPKDYKFNSFEVAWLWGAHAPVNFGTMYTFTIHDLVHDLAQFVAKDHCLLVNSHIQSIHENVQHLSFRENDLLGKSFTENLVGVRTILFPYPGEGANGKTFLTTLVSWCKYLRFLDLSDSTYETLPDSIGKLKHLRYLDIRRNKKLKRLPDSICKLQNLQFLFLSWCTEIETLPKGLRKLSSLREFKITTKQSLLPENELANFRLQVLTIIGCENVESLFSGIELPILEALDVNSCKNLKSLPLDRKHFPALETLRVKSCHMLELFEDHEEQRLRLRSLVFSSLSQLVTLPHWIQGSVNTLLSLLLVDCYNLEVLPGWLSTLTCLKLFVINNCPKLLSLPHGIHCLTALERLEIEDCPQLCRKYQPHVGECWNQISHIKQVRIGETEVLEERVSRRTRIGGSIKL
ncbi:hypothetical protein VNO77_17106 [Canavalia gladiata]|uniref:Uncharacterized protein n=1 Tax=Canavalia gladiata TaxID=3824 RepID=A0AAN9QJ32_CANGL